MLFRALFPDFDIDLSRLSCMRSLPRFSHLALRGVALTACASASLAWGVAATTTTTLAVTSGATKVTTVAAGTVVTLTATVKAGTKAVTLGQVTFCDATAAHCTDIHIVGTASLTSAGTAAIKLAPTAGGHSYKAEYAGTSLDLASASAGTDLDVTSSKGKLTTATTMTETGSAGKYTFKATVTGKGGDVPPTGKVSFLNVSKSNASLGSVTLTGGKAGPGWAAVKTPAIEPAPESVVTGDFNGDGIPDIAIGTAGTSATGGIGYIGILLGKGDGTFLAAANFAAQDINLKMATAQFVNGGPLDILTINGSVFNNAAVFTGDGKGGGSVGTPFSLGAGTVNSVTTADLNRDGSMDFVVSGLDYGISVFAVVLGKGNGIFQTPTLFPVGSAPLFVAVGDFNGDAIPDIAVADSGLDTVSIFTGDGAGNFTPSSTVLDTGTTPSALLAADFDGDGNTDLAVANSGSNNVSIFMGDGTGGFTKEASPATGKHPSAIAIGDFNGDGNADLAVADSVDSNVALLLGKGDGTFTAGPKLATGAGPGSLAVGNFNGNAGVATANGVGGTISVWLSQNAATATATLSGVPFAGPGTLKVDASYPGDSNYSASVSSAASITAPAATPVFSPVAGSYKTVQSVKITDATKGAAIYYTTDGTTPTASSKKYTAAIKVSATQTVKAIAIATGYARSAVAIAAYYIGKPTATPTFTPVGGKYSTAQSVAIKDATAGAVIYYTVNGATPTTASTKYTKAIAVAATKTVKAIAIAPGLTPSVVASATYTIP